jgi:predicted trehalose synthase
VLPPRGTAERLLRIFELEKAIYEVGYELANRPDWVEVPVRGINRLLEESV